MDYILAIVEQTRHHESLALGVSPRGSQALYRAVQALALVEGRDYAIPGRRQAAGRARVRASRGDQYAHHAGGSGAPTPASASSKRFSARWSSPVNRHPHMKTAIIGLPMTGKTSLFTILTGVHQETRMGSTAARTGVAKVPDARLEALAASSSRPRSPTPRSNTWTCHRSPRRACATPPTWPACAWATRSPTCCACSKTKPFRTKKARWTRCAISRTSKRS